MTWKRVKAGEYISPSGDFRIRRVKDREYRYNNWTKRMAYRQTAYWVIEIWRKGDVPAGWYEYEPLLDGYDTLREAKEAWEAHL